MQFQISCTLNLGMQTPIILHTYILHIDILFHAYLIWYAMLAYLIWYASIAYSGMLYLHTK